MKRVNLQLTYLAGDGVHAPRVSAYQASHQNATQCVDLSACFGHKNAMVRRSEFRLLGVVGQLGHVQCP